MSDDFSRPNGPNNLIVNEWSYFNPDDAARVKSTSWQMTSGSLFSVNGLGWTGVPDDTAPDRYSGDHTDSQVFRLNTTRQTSAMSCRSSTRASTASPDRPASPP